ncbi:YhjD/YihY/BrkB family envelope integrity protein [Streptomyces sp. NPDC102395]|uniref:YhjD/YihY/BrkB family envelope integrity protein n=1 Tax=Streptomyces sp. NPDC102395 TaxID=3366168 RepID=UPI003805C145
METSGTRRRAPRVLSPSWWRLRTAELTARAEAFHRRLEIRLPVITRLVDRMAAVNILDSATRLAAQCFLTAVPLLFVLSAYAPTAVQEQLVASVSDAFGLAGEAKAQLEHAFRPPDEELQQATGIIGTLMVLISATAVSRAMQRLCRRAWAIPRSEARVAPWRWLAWIVLWVGFLLVQGPLRDGFGLGMWLGIPLSLLTQTALWWWTQHLLMGGVVPWAPLLPGAVITAVSVTALSLTARIYMPRALNRALADYGSAGSVFVLLSWLIVVCVAITVGITTGAVLSREPFLAHRLAPRT